MFPKIGIFNKFQNNVVERPYDIIKRTLELELHILESLSFYLLDVGL